MDASFSRTLTAASSPSTSLTAHSARRTALVTAAQTMSSPSGAYPLWPCTVKAHDAAALGMEGHGGHDQAWMAPICTLV